MDLHKLLAKYIRWLENNSKDTAGVDIWIKNLKSVMDRLDDEKDLAGKLITAFGGMGSLNDLIFYRNKQYDNRRMLKYYDYNNRVYSLSKDILSKSNNQDP